MFHEHRSGNGDAAIPAELSDKDLALDRAVPFGSVETLNAAPEMEPISWPRCGHPPYAPAEQTAGYLELIGNLGTWL